MVRQFIAILSFVMFIPCLAFAEQRCSPQSYDSSEEPDFRCPGPQEGVLAPGMASEMSIPIYRGYELRDPDGELVARAQWDGAFVHSNRMLSLGLRIMGLRRLRWLDRLRITSESEIAAEHAGALCTAQIERMQAERDAYVGQVRDARASLSGASMWYRSWWFGALMGVVVSVGVIFAAIYALDATTPD